MPPLTHSSLSSLTHFHTSKNKQHQKKKKNYHHYRQSTKKYKQQHAKTKITLNLWTIFITTSTTTTTTYHTFNKNKSIACHHHLFDVRCLSFALFVCLSHGLSIYTTYIYICVCHCRCFYYAYTYIHTYNLKWYVTLCIFAWLYKNTSTRPSLTVVSSLRHVPKPGYGLAPRSHTFSSTTSAGAIMHGVTVSAFNFIQY